MRQFRVRSTTSAIRAAPGARGARLFRSRRPGCLWRAASIVPALLLLAGCKREDIRAYRAPKDSEGGRPAATAGQRSAPRIRWRLPAGWQELAPGPMRAGYFSVTGQDGQKAQVTVIALAGMGGSDLDNVNRWRGQVGLGPVNQEELGKLSQPVDIAGESGEMFEFAGTPAGQAGPVRLLAAVARRGEWSWYFKMTGADTLVGEQKRVFIDFLKGVSFASEGE